QQTASLTGGSNVSFIAASYALRPKRRHPRGRGRSCYWPGKLVQLRHRQLEGRQLMGRRGFTLIELMLSLVILTVVLVSLAKHTGIFLHTVSTSTARTTAAEVARQRLGL